MKFEKIYKSLIENIDGEDSNREGLLNTPKRCSKAFTFLTQGYHSDPKKILSEAIFTEPYNQMVLVKDIQIYSLCEHHLLPFYGKCHVAYVPQNKIVGLSKIPRVVKILMRRLQVQERLTTQIQQVIQEALEPQGVAVVIKAFHLCMAMRGVEEQNSSTVTSAISGCFEEDAARQEFLRLIYE